MSVSSLGDLTITSGVDASGLSAGLDDAKAQVESAAGAMADALGKVPPAAQSAGDALGGMAPPAQKFSDAAQSIIDRQEKLEAKAASLAGALRELTAGYEAGTVSASTLARAQDQLDAVMAKVEGSTHSAGEAVKSAGESAHEAGMRAEGMMEAFGKITGVALGAEALYEFAKAGLETFESLEKADIAITALTGSAATAKDEVEGFISIAQSDALSLPQVISAGQRMAAAGMSAEQMRTALQLAADTAAATGRSFDETSNALYRIVESGTASSRMLVQLGINSQDLASVMGVSATEVQSALKAMDPSERTEVMEQALKKFAGTAQLTADTVGGQWQVLKTNSELAFAGMAEAMAPAAKNTLAFLNEAVVPMVAGTVSGFQDASHAIQSFDQATGQIIHDAIQFTGLGKSAREAADGLDAAGRSADGLNHRLIEGDAPMSKLSDLWKAAGPNLKDFSAGLGLVTSAMQLLTSHVAALPGTIGTLADATSKGAASANTYGQQLRGAWEAATAGGPVTTKLVDDQTKADQALTAARASLAALTDAYNNHRTTEDGAIVTKDLLTRAQNAVTEAYKKAHPELQSLKDATDQEIISERSLTDAFNEQSKLASGATAIWGSLFAKYQEGKISLDQLVSSQKELEGIMTSASGGIKSAQELEQNLIVTQDKLVDSARSNIQAYVDLSQTYDLDAPIMVKAMDAVTKSLKAAGLTLDDLMAKPGEFKTEMVVNGKVVEQAAEDSAAALRKIAEAMDPEATMAADVLKGHIGAMADSAVTSLGPVQQALVDAANAEQLLAGGATTAGNAIVSAMGNAVTAAQGALAEFDAVDQAMNDLAATGSSFGNSMSGGGGGHGGRGGYSPFFQGNPGDMVEAFQMTIASMQAGMGTFGAIPAMPGDPGSQWSLLADLAASQASYVRMHPMASSGASGGGGSAPSASKAPASTTSPAPTGSGNSLTDWLNSFAAAVSNASATIGAGTTALPDWVTRLDAALKTISGSTTQASGATLPDWVQQVSDMITQATQGKSIVDMTQLGSAIQGVLASMPQLTTEISRLGVTTGAAGVTMSDVASSLVQQVTALTTAANYNPPSFQSTGMQLQSTLNSLPPVAPGSLPSFGRPGATPLYGGGIQPLLNPIPNGMPDLSGTMQQVTNSSTSHQISIGQITLSGPDAEQVGNLLTQILQRKGIRP